MSFTLWAYSPEGLFIMLQAPYQNLHLDEREIFTFEPASYLVWWAWTLAQMRPI